MSSTFPYLTSLMSKTGHLLSPEMLTPLRIKLPFPRLEAFPLFPWYTGQFKSSMNFLLRLAWSTKVQLPLLIAIAFMAFDIRLQLEINIFWENQRQVQNNQVVIDDDEEDDQRLNGIQPLNLNNFAFLDQLMENDEEEEDDDDIDDDEDDDDETLENTDSDCSVYTINNDNNDSSSVEHLVLDTKNQSQTVLTSINKNSSTSNSDSNRIAKEEEEEEEKIEEDSNQLTEL